MGAALALAQRGVGQTHPNPPVGCVIVHGRDVVGRGWTQPGGRPHAEAMTLDQAGKKARDATAYVTLEPCAHQSQRGPACADSLITAGLARVVIAAGDPDPRTNGAGIARLQAAGITVTTGIRAAEARTIMAGFLSRLKRGRPHITLKLAVSLDGSIAMANGTSRWITGPRARAHAHLERARADMILIGRGTLEADAPSLDVRLPGLTTRSPQPALLSHTSEAGYAHISSLAALASADAGSVLAEGGAGLAASLLAADLVDRLLLYRAPILLAGQPALKDIGLASLAAAHGRWQPGAILDLAPDRLETYTRIR